MGLLREWAIIQNQTIADCGRRGWGGRGKGAGECKAMAGSVWIWMVWGCSVNGLSSKIKRWAIAGGADGAVGQGNAAGECGGQ